MKKIIWPENKTFAFTIFDDKDMANLNNVKVIYDFLINIGLRTTKSIWPIHSPYNKNFRVDTLEEEAYVDWLKALKEKHFEIGMHNATYNTSTRETTLRAFNKFYQAFGEYPVTLTNHKTNQENIYWGPNRLSGLHRLIYQITTLHKYDKYSEGENKASPLFWGDLCQKHIKYVRNFIFSDLNTLKVCPLMPYHDPDKPYVNYWFASSNGSNATIFTHQICEKTQDKLVAEGGACIMYTHFASGFAKQGKINPEFKRLFTRLSQLNGWFVPVKTLLDFLLSQQKTEQPLSSKERQSLERKWLLDQFSNKLRDYVK